MISKATPSPPHKEKEKTIKIQYSRARIKLTSECRKHLVIFILNHVQKSKLSVEKIVEYRVLEKVPRCRLHIRTPIPEIHIRKFSMKPRRNYLPFPGYA